MKSFTFRYELPLEKNEKKMSPPREEEEEEESAVAHETFFLSRPSSSSSSLSGGGSRNVFVRIDQPHHKDDNNNKRVNLLLIFSHGLHEHSSRFEKTFTFWAKRDFNFACVSFDHIGHGRSDGLKCKHQIESFEQCVEDFRAVIAHARERFGFDVPVALAGVSLGGLFALHAAMTYPKDFFFAIVLIAPAINVKWTAQKKALALVGEVIARATPNMKVAGDDAGEFDRRRRDGERVRGRSSQLRGESESEVWERNSKSHERIGESEQRGTFGWDIEKCVRGARGEGRGDVRGIYRKVVLALVEIHPKQTVREADAH